MLSFHSSPASSPSSAASVIARPAPSVAEIRNESVVVSSYDNDMSEPVPKYNLISSLTVTLAGKVVIAAPSPSVLPSCV